MRKYNYQKIQELLNPIFDFMQTEYPNDYCLVIDSYSAELKHNHSEMVFLDKPTAEKLGEKMQSSFFRGIIKNFVEQSKRKENKRK